MKMAKVLKTKRGEKVSYSVADATYQFFAGANNPNCDGMELIQNDAHAEALLKAHPDELSIVPENKWPARYKKSVEAYAKAVVKEAAEKYPALKERILGKKEK
jgi:hypothetical protein